MTDPQGLSFDSTAEDYERGRTGWPREVLDGLAGDVALDLAAGTGKLTRLLVERFPRVVAVEPSAGMRAVGMRVAPRAEWLAGTAEAIPLPDASVDAVTVGEAFHWFDPHRAPGDIARVLRSGGKVLAVFNTWEGSYEPSIPEAADAAIEAVAERTGPGGRQKIEAGHWRAGLSEGPFAPLEYREFPHVDVADRDGVIAYFLSVSPVAARPQHERDELRETLRRLISDGEYRLHLRAEVWLTRRV